MSIILLIDRQQEKTQLQKMETSALLLPLFPGTIPTGQPVAPSADTSQFIDLTSLIANPQSTFVVRSKGLSMINAFIPPDAMLLVDKSISPQNGDIVVASINGEYTIKYLQTNDYKSRLIPANRKFPEIPIEKDSGFRILGVVTHIISQPQRPEHIY